MSKGATSGPSSLGIGYSSFFRHSSLDIRHCEASAARPCIAFLTSEGDHMASEPTGPTPPPSGGLQEMLARLKGMVQAMEGDKEDAEEVVPTVEPEAEPPEAELVDPVAEPLPAEVVPVALAPCPICGSDRKAGQSWCGDCGYTFAEGTVPGTAAPVAAPAAPVGP